MSRAAKLHFPHIRPAPAIPLCILDEGPVCDFAGQCYPVHEIPVVDCKLVDHLHARLQCALMIGERPTNRELAGLVGGMIRNLCDSCSGGDEAVEAAWIFCNKHTLDVLNFSLDSGFTICSGCDVEDVITCLGRLFNILSGKTSALSLDFPRNSDKTIHTHTSSELSRAASSCGASESSVARPDKQM